MSFGQRFLERSVIVCNSIPVVVQDVAGGLLRRHFSNWQYVQWFFVVAADFRRWEFLAGSFAGWFGRRLNRLFNSGRALIRRGWYGFLFSGLSLLGSRRSRLRFRRSW